MMKDLSVITVTHQSALFIEDQVFSVIAGAVKASIEQIIVDNASTDGTAEWLEGIQLKGIRSIRNGANRGFAAANNQGLALAEGRYLLYLNPDMQVQEGSLDRLIEWMDQHPKAGIASCLLVNPLKEPLPSSRPRRLPRLKREMLWLLCLEGWGDKREMEAEGVREVEMVNGAFMLVRREIAQQLGYAFDPRYFLLYEDADLCRTVRELGYMVVFHSDLHCVDFNSRSFATKKGEWIFECYAASMLEYFKKWEAWYRWIFIALAIPLGYILRFGWASYCRRLMRKSR